MLYAVYAIVLGLFTIYSFSQIDLNLTLSSNFIYQNIQRQLILLGYFNRPVSTVIFMFLLIMLYLLYLVILRLVKRKKLTSQKVSGLIMITVIVLFFSYSAFSHDIFNYMFDARIITKYHQNPYIHSALDYPYDLWTRFMHWTHRAYPYGPIWLAVTVPFSFFGFGKFVLTLVNFKILFILFHLGNIYFIRKIFNKFNSDFTLFGVALYAFNPVVLIETLVSPHNEVVMLFFLLLFIYGVFISNNRLLAGLNLILSAGIKFITILLLPVFLVIVRQKKKELGFGWMWLFLFLMIIAMTAEIYYREPYPWYFLPIIGLGTLFVSYPSIVILIWGFSLGALARYIPFLYFGEYSKSMMEMQNQLFIGIITVPILLLIIFKIQKKLNFY